MKKIIRFFKDEDGMELTEYAVVGGLIILAVVAIFGFWGAGLANIFTSILTNMNIATSA